MHFDQSYNMRWKINLLHICEKCFLKRIELGKKTNPNPATKTQEQMIYLMVHAFVQSWITRMTVPYVSQ